QTDLKWITATEINNDYFTIERSANGTHFENLLNVDGAGNSTVELAYKALDPSPYRGITYYRLKQTDFDGKFTYSNIVAVKLSGHSNIDFWPNPATNSIDISTSAHDNLQSLFLTDNLGQIVMIIPVNGMTTVHADISSLAQGVYYLNAVLNDEKIVRKLIKTIRAKQ